MNRKYPKMVKHLPFDSSTAVDMADHFGRVLNGVWGPWRVLQIGGFRLVIMWPHRKSLADVHWIRERR